jgi:hypothetical protein
VGVLDFDVFTGTPFLSQVELGKRGPVRVREINVEKAEIGQRDILWVTSW